MGVNAWLDCMRSSSMFGPFRSDTVISLRVMKAAPVQYNIDYRWSPAPPGQTHHHQNSGSKSPPSVSLHKQKVKMAKISRKSCL